MDFHDGWQSGDLVSRAVMDISRIRRFVGFGLIFAFQMGIQFALILARMFTLDVSLALVSVAFCLPVVVVSHRFSRLYHQISRQSQDEQGDLGTIVEESGTGVRIIKAFGRMPERSAIFRAQAEKLFRTNLRGVEARKNLWFLDVLPAGVSFVGILLVGGQRVVSGAMTIGALTQFVLYQQMLAWPVREIGWIIAMGQEASAAAERVFELLDTPPDIADAPGATPLVDRVAARSRSTTCGSVPGERCVGPARSRPPRPPGETLALVGMTGCGQDDGRGARLALLRSDARIASRSTATICATITVEFAALARAVWPSRTRSCSRSRSARTS